MGDELTVAGKVRGRGWICMRFSPGQARKMSVRASLWVFVQQVQRAKTQRRLYTVRSVMATRPPPEVRGPFCCFHSVGEFSFRDEHTHTHASTNLSLLPHFFASCQLPACSHIWTQANMLPFFLCRNFFPSPIWPLISADRTDPLSSEVQGKIERKEEVRNN